MIELAKYLAGCLICWMVFGFAGMVIEIGLALREGWCGNEDGSDPEA